MSNSEQVEIMGIPFNKYSEEELLNEYLLPRLSKNERTYIVTANPEIVMQTRIDKVYKDNVMKADFIVPDGAGIIAASKIVKNPIAERVTGYDLMLRLLKIADKKGYSVYLLGASEEVNKQTAENLQKNYPNLIIAGRNNGYFKEDAHILAEIDQVKPDFVFVAMGFPKQENWIGEHLNLFEKGLFMGVGGVFDILAGNIKRAPKIWIKLNLEWLYRLIKQPFRWKRILKAFEFIFRILLRR